MALARRGELKAAAVQFKHAVRLSPKVSLYWLNLASVQRRLQLDDEALASALCATAIDSTCRLSCHLAVALSRARQGHAQALALFEG